jgi:hypothetical protein
VPVSDEVGAARGSGAGLTGWYGFGWFAEFAGWAMPVVGPPNGVVDWAVSIGDLL